MCADLSLGLRGATAFLVSSHSRVALADEEREVTHQLVVLLAGNV